MSLFALSSPPPHIYTPQRQHRYAPQTPSPLRTSRNANFMPPPTTPESTVKATPDSKWSPFSFTTPTSTVGTGSTPQSTSTTASALPFQFQRRARSQSPQATLAQSNAAAKTRRSSAFLDKVRQKREDARFEARGEQALRMDFVRERRAWEERLKRRAPSFGVDVDDTVVDDVDQKMEDKDALIDHENAVPSPTEDREIEELLSYLLTDDTSSMGGDTKNAFAVHDATKYRSKLDTISDDEEYDQLFMEVLGNDGGMLERPAVCQPQQYHESSMDLS